MDADEAEVDLENQVVRFDGREVPFEIDAEIKHRLLNGLDDIAVTLEQGDAIDAYERERERPGPGDDGAVTPARLGRGRPTSASRTRSSSGRSRCSSGCR